MFVNLLNGADKKVNVNVNSHSNTNWNDKVNKFLHRSDFKEFFYMLDKI